MTLMGSFIHQDGNINILNSWSSSRFAQRYPFDRGVSGEDTRKKYNELINFKDDMFIVDAADQEYKFR